MLIGAVVSAFICVLILWLWARSHPPVRNFGMLLAPDIRELAPLIALFGGVIGAISGALTTWVVRQVLVYFL